MDEIKELMNSWKNGDYINPDALKAAYDAVTLLVAKVEELEAQVQALSK
jgi:hypothetical protein